MIHLPWSRRQANIEAQANRAVEHALQTQFIERARQNTDPTKPLTAMSQYGNQWLLGPPGGSPKGAYAMDNPINFSTPNTPTSPPGKVISTYTMRDVAKNCDVMRACINHLKREIAAVPLIFVPVDPKDDSDETKAQIKEAEQFISEDGPLGGRGMRRTNFESELFEDLLVLGCQANVYQLTRGGDILQVDNVAAETIRPVVDAYGWPPDADNPLFDVYEQWILGIKTTGFTRAEMRYDGLYPVTWSPFYDSPIEYLIVSANTYLRAQQWNLTWLTNGTSNDQWLKWPAATKDQETLTPDQWNMWVNLLTAANEGSSRNRHKMKALPPGAEISEGNGPKDGDFSKLNIQLVRLICSIYGVAPASVGFVGEQYMESQGQSMETTTQFGAGICFDYRAHWYDDLCFRKKWDRIKSANEFLKEEDQKLKAEVSEILIRSGQRSPNELRTADGIDPYPGGEIYVMQNTMVPVNMVGQDTQAEKGADSGDAAAVSGDKSKSNAKDDMKRWERKALSRLRQNGNAACSFTSGHIAPEIATVVLTRLADCRTAGEVRTTFETVIGRLDMPKDEPLPDIANMTDAEIADNTEEISFDDVAFAVKTSTPEMKALLLTRPTDGDA